jgi:hypothetical protein
MVSPRDFLVVTGKIERDGSIYIPYTNISDEYRPDPVSSNYVRYIIT